ncbi:hypothetical protein [Aliidiomarina celeris]|uniref:hypothetical protein n=1 Tax=Aliidiomarina celeris TaxID=2249428 RepID=UPI000DEA49F4|nr:hypothetical protein [Aliidiomarina celeris]
MIDLLHAILFTAMVAAGGLGLASVIMTFIPVITETMSADEVAKERVEYAFFGFAGIVIALVMILAMALS